MYWCVDCGEPDGPDVFEANPRQDGEPWVDFLILFAASIAAWFEEWLNGEIDYEGRFNAHLGV